MISHRELVLSSIKKKVMAIDPTANIILYGSRARGDERPDSDWDILILINTKADLETEKVFRHKLFEVELELGEALSTQVYNKQEWKSKYWMTPLYKNIATDGLPISR